MPALVNLTPVRGYLQATPELKGNLMERSSEEEAVRELARQKEVVNTKKIVSVIGPHKRIKIV